MKKSKLNTESALLLASVMALALMAGAEGSVAKDIVYFTAQKTMVNEGVLPDASGEVKIQGNAQSKKNKQSIRITVKNLAPETTYQVATSVDTNFAQVAEFTTDSNGKASIEFRDSASSSSKGKGKGKTKEPLPAELSPVNTIRALAILDDQSQAVLTADLATPDKLNYVVKRDLGLEPGKGSVHIKAKQSNAQVRVSASGLEPNAEYTLALNGTAAETGTTDSKGKLKLATELESAPDILALQSVELLDALGNVAGSATVP